MLRHRIFTVLVVLPAFLAALFFLPQRQWGALMLVVVFLATIEWARLAALTSTARGLFICAVILGCVAAVLTQPVVSAFVVFAVGTAFWVLVVPLWLKGLIAVTSLRLALAGWVVLVGAWYALFVLQANPGRLLALLGVVWIADTAAYFAGRRFGRRKLAPAISPGKTWEGVLGAIVLVGVYYASLKLAGEPGFLAGDWRVELLLVMALVALSIEGDLFESWMKRRAGMKDSGSILPGHGGVLDRIDGLVAVLPLSALVVMTPLWE